MSTWSQNGHGMVEDDDLDDATVEALLAGRYKGDASDLTALTDVLQGVRSFAEAPVPPPSAALVPILRGSSPASDKALPTPSRRWLRGPGQQRSPGPPRRKAVGVPAVAAAISAALVSVAVVAGSARLLPGPTQDVVARIIRTVTPFDFPERRGPEAVLSRAPRPGTALPTEKPVPAGDDAPPGEVQPGTDGNQATGRDRSGGGPPGPAPTTTMGPRPTATVPGPAAPTVPTTNGRPSDGGAGRAPTVPPPRPAKPGALTADLVGAPDPQRPGAPVGTGTAVLESNPGSDELCLTLVLSGTTPVTAVHLHAGALGTSGRVVASFPTPRNLGTSRMCVTVTGQVIKEIRKEPGQYYVEVHTADVATGTLSGQLTK